MQLELFIVTHINDYQSWLQVQSILLTYADRIPILL